MEAAQQLIARWIDAGPLRLDLFHRDAEFDGRWLALHPREFALLWRLAETPGATVSQRELLRDVWRLPFEPGTNRVAVHVARLRRKLEPLGLAAMIATDGPGYRLDSAAPLRDEQSSLIAMNEKWESARMASQVEEQRVAIDISEDGVAHLRLNRADKMNALDVDMFTALTDAGIAAGKDNSVRAVVLSWDGPGEWREASDLYKASIDAAPSRLQPLPSRRWTPRIPRRT